MYDDNNRNKFLGTSHRCMTSLFELILAVISLSGGCSLFIFQAKQPIISTQNVNHQIGSLVRHTGVSRTLVDVTNLQIWAKFGKFQQFLAKNGNSFDYISVPGPVLHQF